MFCRNCGKELIGSPEICPECGAKPTRGNSFCSNCGAPTTPLTEMCVKCGVRVVGRVEAGLREMNWFQRHLNYTVVLSWLASYLLFIMLIAFGAFVLEPYMNLAAIAGGVFFWLVLITCEALPLFVAGWALRRKNRSLWWLLILFVPFGWIVFLCLENRSR